MPAAVFFKALVLFNCRHLIDYTKKLFVFQYKFDYFNNLYYKNVIFGYFVYFDPLVLCKVQNLSLRAIFFDIKQPKPQYLSIKSTIYVLQGIKKEAIIITEQGSLVILFQKGIKR